MNILFKIFAALILLSGIVTAAEAGLQQKPQAPAEISIAPTQTRDGQPIRPGEVVSLTISTTGFIEIDELLIETFLLGGAEFVSGDRNWKGSASRNETKKITLTVRSPLQGAGMVRARVSLYRGGERLTMKQILFDFGAKTGNYPKKPVHPSRRDYKGRVIVEY